MFIDKVVCPFIVYSVLALVIFPEAGSHVVSIVQFFAG